jgi:hypothetical protein
MSMSRGRRVRSFAPIIEGTSKTVRSSWRSLWARVWANPDEWDGINGDLENGWGAI